MKFLPWLVTGASLVALLVFRPLLPSSSPSTPAAKKEEPAVQTPTREVPPLARKVEPPADEGPYLDVKGQTQCVPGRKAIIAPVPLHPVVEVLVVAGQRVKKNQPLVKLDDDEAQADVRAKAAALESARINLKEHRRLLPQARETFWAGALPEATYYRMKADMEKAVHDECAAQAALESAKAELEHYVVTAGVNGVISWLDVHLGTVSKPGAAVWGEILDLSEIDVRCELTPEHADRVEVGQPAEIRRMGKSNVWGVGKVVLVGIAADRTSGLVPVIVRLANPKGLRSETPVQVRFTEPLAAHATR